MIKLTNGLTRHLNACTSQPLCIKPNRDCPILAKNNNSLDYFMQHKRKKYTPKNKK